MSDQDEARRRVRQLLLSGDNTVKLRAGGPARTKARERFVAARALAVQEGLEPELVELIDRRLAQLSDTPSSAA